MSVKTRFLFNKSLLNYKEIYNNDYNHLNN